jgi:Lrp/AsnC family transcriptional regulator for asnA, asnC and gidA
MVDSDVKIDEIDVKILKALLRDARTNFTDVARECGVSTNTIVKHFYRLKQSQVITGTSLRINLQEMGYTNRLSIDINVESGKETEIINNLKIHDLVACHMVIGSHDIHAVLYLRDFGQAEKIRNIIKKQEGVRKIRLTATYEGGLFPENLLIQPTETS